jgi:hypothetical protein
MAFQSQVGQVLPSTSTVAAPATSFGSGTQSANASPISGLSRSQRRLTVGWLTSKMAPTTSWGDVLAQQRDHHRDRAVQAEHVGATVGVEVALDGADAGGQLGSCPSVSPVIASYRSGFSLCFHCFDRQRKSKGGSRCFIERDTRYWPDRVQIVLQGLGCSSGINTAQFDSVLMNKAPGIAGSFGGGGVPGMVRPDDGPRVLAVHLRPDRLRSGSAGTHRARPAARDGRAGAAFL